MNLQDKRILVMTSVYPTTPDGNHGSFVREAILRLQPTGAQFSVFAPAYEGSPSYCLDGVEVYRFRYCPKPFENLVRDGAPTKIQRQPLYLIAAGLYIALGSWQLFWICWRQRPNLLHVNWPFPHALMALPASQLLNIPMVFSFHGAELLLARKFGFVAQMLRWLMPMARGLTANSSFTRGLIGKLTDREVQVIPYGLTIEAKPAKPRQAGEVPTLLFVGRLDERKGLCYLLEALPLLLREGPVRLRVVGKGILEAELISHCQALGLEGVVDFLGFVSKEELADEYARCDVFVLPAIVDSKGDTEGLGIVMIEALAHQKPVVATEVGGIPDVIVSGKTGVLVCQKDPQALAEAIADLLANPEKATTLGESGFQDIQQRFSWQRIVPLWERVFERAIADRSVSRRGWRSVSVDRS
ncbi:glycosyltransferase family 4 protein [Oscillatoria laete-virens NRMC-F 0139]|nr:glycosyltransferase family 4 protein [Oscillatoria laete-virens]MDL5053966.1 glycosyltransferase family 4 protein [Oscillatoria laete-virens NRMC-F 0139]